MTQAEAGKGSGLRPRQISNEEWASRWDAIFSRDLEKDKREQALDEMVRVSQELGLYDEPELQETQESTTGHDRQDNSR